MQVFTMHESPIEEVPCCASVYFLGMPWVMGSNEFLVGKLPYQNYLFDENSWYGASYSDDEERTKFSGYCLDKFIHERALALLLHHAHCIVATSPLLVLDKLSDNKNGNYVQFPTTCELKSLGFTNFVPATYDLDFDEFLITPREVDKDIYISIRLKPEVVVQVREEL